MKEVAEYIGSKFRYGFYIHHSPENNIKTVVPSLTITNGTGDNGGISRNKKLVWEKIMMEYVKQDTKLDDNCHKSYTLIFRQCTNNMRLKLEDNED